MDALAWAGIVVCLSQSAIFSGLNLAMFGVSRLRLETEVETGNVAAKRVLALRQDANFLLTTILWGNVSVNVLLALLSESVFAGIGGFVFSTVGITFFGEMLPEYDWNASVEAISRCDLLLVLGTSLLVYPAAGLPGYRPWTAKMVIVNRDPTPLDAEAQLVIHEDLCEVMVTVSKALNMN